jgi:hypothetical protein
MRAAYLLPLLLIAAVSCGEDPVQPEPEPDPCHSLNDMLAVPQEQQVYPACPIIGGNQGGYQPATPPPIDREPVIPPGRP